MISIWYKLKFITEDSVSNNSSHYLNHGCSIYLMHESTGLNDFTDCGLAMPYRGHPAKRTWVGPIWQDIIELCHQTPWSGSSSAKPLPKPILDYHQFDQWKKIHKISIQTLSFNKMQLRILCATWHPFCSGLMASILFRPHGIHFVQASWHPFWSGLMASIMFRPHGIHFVQASWHPLCSGLMASILFRPHVIHFVQASCHPFCSGLIELTHWGRDKMAAIFKCISLNGNVWISIKISPKFVPKGWIKNIPALVQILAWCRSVDKPLSAPMMVRLLTHICITLPQWVKQCNFGIMRIPATVTSSALREHFWSVWEVANCLRSCNRHYIGIESFVRTNNVIARMLPAFCKVQYVEIQWCILSDIVESRYNKTNVRCSKRKSNAKGWAQSRL